MTAASTTWDRGQTHQILYAFSQRNSNGTLDSTLGLAEEILNGRHRPRKSSGKSFVGRDNSVVGTIYFIVSGFVGEPKRRDTGEAALEWGFVELGVWRVIRGP